VQGNLFQLNAGNGVNNASANDYIVEYNSWGHLAGDGLGDGSSGSLDTNPWTHVVVFMESSGSPLPDKVTVGSEIVYTVKMDAAEVYGADFDLNFDNTVLEVQSITDGGLFQHVGGCGISSVVDANASSQISFCGQRTTALTGAGQVMYEVVFKGVAPGFVGLDFADGNDVFAMAPPGGASNNIYAHALVDGSVTVYTTYAVTGRLDLQGRANDSGAVLTLGLGSVEGFGPYAFSSSDYWGAIGASGVVEDTYPITVVMDRYLDVTVGSGKTVGIGPLKTALSKLVLLGGDANDDDMIDIGDAALIGGQFGMSPPTNPQADINADNTVNILDLALMGGNFGKDSATAYATWTP
jgi:hypothetical protein